MKKKYYLITLEVYADERTFYPQSLHFSATKDPMKLAMRFARGYYGDFDRREDDSFFFGGCGEVRVEVCNIQEITPDEYDVLNKFL